MRLKHRKARKGVVYFSLNVITGMYYIGSSFRHPRYRNRPHRMGLGRTVIAALLHYGPSAFRQSIIYEGPNIRHVETWILNELDAANDPMSYNQLGSKTAKRFRLPQVTPQELKDIKRSREHEQALADRYTMPVTFIRLVQKRRRLVQKRPTGRVQVAGLACRSGINSSARHDICTSRASNSWLANRYDVPVRTIKLIRGK